MIVGGLRAGSRYTGRVRRLLWCSVLLAVSCRDAGPTAPPAATERQTILPPAAIRVLFLTATAGFRHDSIATAKQVIADLASSNGFALTTTEALPDVDATRLSASDVLVFALTSGELPFDDMQRDAIVNFVNNGGGFVGFHSASDTLYEWPEYGRIVGAYFKEHPWTQDAMVTVEDRGHQTTAGLGGSLRLLEEFYTFRQNPRPSVHVLLSLDAQSVAASGDYPLAWTQTIGRGRSYYNALGHFDATWRSSSFQLQIVNAIRWAAGR